MNVPSRLRMGMIGGGRDAFIGAVHRMAARLDGEIELVAGALSSTPEKALASGREVGLPHDRNYPTWQEMLERESKRGERDRLDFVSIVTPNHCHYEIARGFAQAGFNIVIDKPMVTTIEEAEELVKVVQRSGVQFAVTYNYSGYPMVKQAREMVRSGELGEIRKVIVEYRQGWLATPLEQQGQKQAAWRTNPRLAGAGGAIGDIGSHAEQLVSYVTGLHIESLAADLTSFVAERAVDDDASVLLRFSNGARGVLIASQVCVGERNNLRLRVWGTKAGLDWQQEQPNVLIYKPADGPERAYHRGEAYLCDAAKGATRLPPGHPEAFIEAFANIYREFAGALRKPGIQADFPGLADGIRGVRFIDASLRSSRQGGAWVQLGE